MKSSCPAKLTVLDDDRRVSIKEVFSDRWKVDDELALDLKAKACAAHQDKQSF